MSFFSRRAARRSTVLRWRTAPLFAGVLAVALWSVAPSGALATGRASRAAPTSATLTLTAGTHKIHLFPTMAYSQAHSFACTTDCTALTYHGGPVQHGEKEYFIFWVPSGYYMPPSYRSDMNTWLKDVSALDYTPKDVFGVAQQYYDNSGPGGARSFVPYNVGVGHAIVDTHALPTKGCTDTDGGATLPACLTDQQIQSEIQRVVSAHSLPRNLNTEYLLFTPNNVGSCFTGTSTACAYTYYCAYHSYINTTSGPILYANMPWLWGTAGCDAESFYAVGYPNASSIDPEVGVVSHELIETMTDPEVNAWYDGSGNEIGDKCAYNYNGISKGGSSGLPNNGLGYWNQNIHNDEYMMQLEYSNFDTNCVPSDDDTQPVVSISVSPSSPTHGTAAQFTANVTDPAGVNQVQWTFGDGTATVTGNPVNHTYASAGTYKVTVVVTDNHGNEASVTQSVAVS